MPIIVDGICLFSMVGDRGMISLELPTSIRLVSWFIKHWPDFFGSGEVFEPDLEQWFVC